ncbi:MAG: R3H domain-containing nucleic acid-binding protein [Dehalococcoidia bacterium]
MELSPQSSYVRRLQHQMAEKYSLSTRSQGREPVRRVHIFKGQSR